MINIRLILTVLDLAKLAAGTLYASRGRRRVPKGHDSSVRPASPEPLHFAICTLFSISLLIVPFTVSPPCISASGLIIYEQRCESLGSFNAAFQSSGDPFAPSELPFWAMVTNGLAL